MDCYLTYNVQETAMTAPEDYLRFSEECIELSQRVTDPQSRTRLLEMAQAWRELADEQPSHEPPEL